MNLDYRNWIWAVLLSTAFLGACSDMSSASSGGATAHAAYACTATSANASCYGGPP